MPSLPHTLFSATSGAKLRSRIVYVADGPPAMDAASAMGATDAMDPIDPMDAVNAKDDSSKSKAPFTFERQLASIKPIPYRATADDMSQDVSKLYLVAMCREDKPKQAFSF